MKFKQGLNFGGLRAAGGGPGPAPTPTIDVVAAYDATHWVFDWTDPASMTAGDGGAVVQGEADTLDTVPNYKSPGSYDLRQTSASLRPVYNNGAVLDGVDDGFQLALPGGANTGPVNAWGVFIYKGTDTGGLIWGTGNNSYYAGPMFSNGSTAVTSVNAGTPAYEIDGLVVSGDRNALHDALSDGTAKVLVVTNADMENSAISQYWFGRLAGGTSTLAGCLMPVAGGSGAEADAASAIAAAKTLAEEQINALGL